MKHTEENIIHGIAAAPGLVIAPAYLFYKETEEVKPESITDSQEAIQNLDAALWQSKKELKKIFELAVDKLGERRAAIFEAQIMILDDPILIDNIKKRIINEKKVPEFIVYDEISKYQKIMNESLEPYMKERSHDIEDIKNRIIRNLKKKKWQSRITNDVVVVSHTISPSDTVLFTRVNVKGYVTDLGGLTSHAAIVARSLNIPAVVGLHGQTSRIHEGDLLVVDGFHGDVVINPTEAQLNHYKNRLEVLNKYDAELLELRNKPALTTDGKEIKLMANLDITAEIDILIQNGANGIGLLRTEQIFEEYEVFPEEEEQYQVYKSLAEKVYPENIIIRAFDIGGDKVLPVDLHEPNPFLGWRGIRLLLDNPYLFKKQIKAVLRASVNKNVMFMLPMISSISEIRKSKKIIEECKLELEHEGVKYDNNIKIGIMVEIPSAAVMANVFAQEVDFISIGTNDLIQYLLAVDRGNEIVSKYYQEFHPSVIKTLHYIIKEGKRENTFISMCGEMAADPYAVPLLVGLGLDSLSVSPATIPLLKKIIRNISFKDAEELANECLTYPTEEEVSSCLRKFFKDKLQNTLQNLF
ncbi:phosphoenolpyruvate--protein phosphotransferase [Melioribacteraceae bacterium 4301-Me]|uniref:phosphoenolpyruvate--protein phosphotransferase n=1 Tax=Pyranulibacter aquaticus TaxID=3163344 RepID=UPI003595E837